tara:strand:+ start:1954 stop:2310 length:357 start_codon:yes stop_codon:yes gene_type:complete
MKMKKKKQIPELEDISLSELFPGIEIEENFRISTAQQFLEAQIEEMHEAICCDTIGDTSIITVNGEIYIYARWDSNGVDLDFRNEGFPALGLMGAILSTVNHVRGHDGEEDSEDYEEI